MRTEGGRGHFWTGGVLLASQFESSFDMSFVSTGFVRDCGPLDEGFDTWIKYSNYHGHPFSGHPHCNIKCVPSSSLKSEQIMEHST